jgi:aryl-alcohol dehydrogenase-like predicted oxidoreductase
VRYRRFEPLGRDLSVLVLGTAYFGLDPPEVVRALLDEWVALGGNAIDSARQYGPSEEILGRWLAEVGGDVTIQTKGAHYDEETGRKRVNPEEITSDLEESLATLGVQTIDLYLLHRDDPARPVGPILETLNAHRRAGRIRVFGASNWTPERLDEAARYAAEHGLETFAYSSPGLSLAEQLDEPWPAAISAHDPATLAWYVRTQLPLFAWSSQAGGLFAGRTGPEVERVYGGERNRERLRRAEELGRDRGFTANQIALAWVLHLPFPTYAIIGPRSVEELRTSVAALAVELTPAEVRWLDLEEDR